VNSIEQSIETTFAAMPFVKKKTHNSRSEQNKQAERK
jgi:hypothetical protein